MEQSIGTGTGRYYIGTCIDKFQMTLLKEYQYCNTGKKTLSSSIAILAKVIQI